MARKTQNELSVKQKLEVLKFVKDHGERKTAIKFCISKTTVNNIKKNAQKLKERVKVENPKMKRKYRSTRFLKVNDLTLDWFYRMRGMDARVSGPMLQEAALYFAEKLHESEFKASSGWLDSFKKRHNISCKVLSGESNDVDAEVVDQFRANIETFVEGFSPDDIFNADECGLFFKALPDRSLVIKGDKCKSGKKSKVRVSVLLTASATGEKLKPFVIGKSLKPRCFKNVKTKDLPVTYTANKKAWMTSKLFEDWVKSVNEDMKKQNRSILLIVDNCPAHPEISPLSNLTLKFLPPNTTSEVQPMDRGIIKNFKQFYRKLLLRMVVSKSDLGVSASVIAKAVTVLDAVKWIDEAWKSVKVATIVNCYRKAGFDLSESHLESKEGGEEEDLDSTSPIQIDGVQYNFQDFVGCDDDVAFTQICDGNELREAVLDDATADDFDDEDLIPLAELRLRIVSNDTNHLDDSQNHIDSIELPNISESQEPHLTVPTDFEHVSKMLQDILTFAKGEIPEMIDPINLCRQLLVNRVAQLTL